VQGDVLASNIFLREGITYILKTNYLCSRAAFLAWSIIIFMNALSGNEIVSAAFFCGCASVSGRHFADQIFV